MINRILRSSVRKPASNSRNYSILSSDSHREILVSLLQSCNQTIQTAQIHGLMLKTGLDTIPFPLSKLLARLSLQDIDYASHLFRETKSPNLYMFNTMLRGYSVSKDPKSALILLNLMRASNPGEFPLLNQFTFVSVLKSCSRLLHVSAGIGVHGVVLASGLDCHLNVKNALLHFYCVCGRIQDAHKLFNELSGIRDLVSWNALMGGYLYVAEHGFVLHLFKDMYREKVGLSETTMVTILSSLGQTWNLLLGQCLHVLTIKAGFLSSLNVATALISMYGKHSSICSARQVFNGIADFEKDVVQWNCLIEAYAKSGLLEEGLKLLKLMELQDNVQPNSSTLAGLLSSGTLSAAEYAHSYINEHELEFDAILGTALVDAYTKNGLLTKAIEVFNSIKRKDIGSWTAMISGYGLHGQAERAVGLFNRMERGGFVPDEFTFLAVLNSCSHNGLVIEGMRFFSRMVEVYGFMPKIEHYSCMVDLLGRAGLLEEAYKLIKGLPVEKDATAWRALLGACRVYGHVNLAKRAKQELEWILGEHPADSMAITGTYAVAGMVKDKENDNHLVKAHFDKKPGYSVIESVW